MKQKNPKVLFVATSRKTMGGITSVLKRYEKMEIWEKYHCAWLETQINKGIALKLWYIIKAYIAMLFIVPRYDIIHFHTVPGRSMLVQLPIFLYSKLWRKKNITHLHVGNQLIAYKDNRLFNFVLRKTKQIVVLANIAQDYIKKYYCLSSRTIYNPIEEQTRIDNTNRENIIFFAAYLCKDKGYETMIEAFARVAKKYPNWKLVISGTGEIDEVKILINKYGIASNVIIYKWLNFQQMRELYKKASIFCIASKKEGFPMTFLEASSYGVPIVTTPVGGLVDVVENERNCMIFNFDNAVEMAEQICKLIESEELRIKISINQQKLIHNSFSIEAINNSLNTLYEELLR